MAYFRVTINTGLNQVSLPNGIVLNAGETTNLTEEDFFMIPEGNHSTLFSDITEMDNATP